MNLRSVTLRSFFWIKDFFRGGDIRSYYLNIKLIQSGDKQLEHLRNEALSKLLNHAIENTKFYNNISSAKLENFPVVNKLILQTNYANVIVPEEKLSWQSGKAYYIQKTSGSTGTPFAVPQDSRKRKRRLAELKYFGEIVGFKSHDKLIQLRVWTQWQSKTRTASFMENIIPFNVSNLNENNLRLLCDTIRSAKAKCLRGYASSFDLLARYVKLHAVKLPSLKIIIAGSEALFDSTRELVEKNIGCNIISQYANEENGILAQERVNDPEHRFYLNEASYFFEVLKFDSDEPAHYGELGRIVITDLFNYAFPIIRYDNGDSCIMELDQKTGKPYISKLYGRRLDLIYNTLGEPILPMSLARVLKNYDGIKQWQFIQEAPVQFTLKLVIHEEESWKNQIAKDVLNQLQEIVGNDANVNFIYTDEIPVLNSGKRKCVVNMCEK